jgi:hypothetical protein
MTVSLKLEPRKRGEWRRGSPSSISLLARAPQGATAGDTQR